MSATTAILPNQNGRKLSSINGKRHGPLYRMSCNEGLFLSLFDDASNTTRVLVVLVVLVILSLHDEGNSGLMSQIYFHSLFL